MSVRPTLVGALVHQAQDLSKTVAEFLRLVEPHLVKGVIPQKLRSPDRLISALGDAWRESSGRPITRLREMRAAKFWEISSEPERSRAVVDRFERRLAGLVIHAWSEVGGRGARRPDVLGLTCQLMANPDAPHTYEVARFAVILALRALYNVQYGIETLHELRRCYTDLQSRFENLRRRDHRHPKPAMSLLMDLLSMEGWIVRSFGDQRPLGYYQAFLDHPLGVTSERVRDFGPGDLPQITGTLPDFGSLLNLAFSQPAGVPGLDEVTGGLMLTMARPDQTSPRPGSLVSLIAGPPGSGKTSLCLTVTSHMAELGAVVRYIATEEKGHNLAAKRATVAEPLASIMRLDHSDVAVHTGDWEVIDGTAFPSLGSLADRLKEDFAQASPPNVPAPGEIPLYLPFSRVVVIDSLTALLRTDTQSESISLEGVKNASDTDRLGRRDLGRILNQLRELGVCVFLTGGESDADDVDGLAYLVDNVFILGMEAEASRRHPIRTMNVSKTRLQVSDRGVHVFHLARQGGCSISPSLHSVLRATRGRPVWANLVETGAVVWTNAPKEPAKELSKRANESATKQVVLPLQPGTGPVDSPAVTPIVGPKTDSGEMAVWIRGRSQILIYGRGPANKARLALALAFEPRVPRERGQWEEYVSRHGAHDRTLTPLEVDSLARSRVLVVSFLYDRDYYTRITEQLFKSRFLELKPVINDYLTTLDFYPGYIDPETLVSRVRRELQGGMLDGRPYTAVVLDGIHNLLLQFPLLEKEPLLWPTLFQIFRSSGLDAISTFTFFRVAHITRRSAGRAGLDESPIIDRSTTTLSGADHLFFQLLVSKCDYSFVVEHSDAVESGIERNWVRVRLATSAGGFGREPEEWWWDPSAFQYRHQV